MRKTIAYSALAGTLLLGGCDTDLFVPDYNNPSIENLQGNPTASTIDAAAIGLLLDARNNIADGNDYVSLLGILGRESYNFDQADPRFVTEMLIGPLSAGSPAFGANLWNIRYRNIRNANALLDAVGRAESLSESDREALRGFAKTIQALDFLLVINTRDAAGAPIDVGRAVSEDPAPIESKDAVHAHIAGLLDEAQAHLQSAGGSFPFPMPSGFEGFDTPGAFLEFNRALRARLAAYQQNYAAALQALGGSFVSTSEPLGAGVYYNFGTGSGDLTNGLFDPSSNPDLRAHPSLRADAQTQPGGALDQRALDKTAEVPLRTVQNIPSTLEFTIYNSPTDPVPIVRNEELILLRAEARWFTGDKEGALADLNHVRTAAGGLAPLPMPASDDAFIDALLYERRMSLMFEGGHRWLDTRRFDRIDALPRDLPSHTIQRAFPIPEAEQLARQ